MHSDSFRKSHMESENLTSNRERTPKSYHEGEANGPVKKMTERSKSDGPNGEENEHRPIIAPGELREMVNKRSESANRKYRAFKHFIKYHNSINK